MTSKTPVVYLQVDFSRLNHITRLHSALTVDWLQKELQSHYYPQDKRLNTNLKRPILRKCENISPPGTNSNTMYKFELS